MLDHAKRYLSIQPWGPIISLIILSAVGWVVIWTIIEPLGIPDSLNIDVSRWIAHLLASLLFGSIFLVILIFLNKTALPFDYLYNVDQAGEFYDAIADGYDSRNSASLLRTQSKIVETIRRQSQAKGHLRILDLGGGTGHGVAHQFFNSTDIEWVYIEISPKMFRKFSENHSGSNLLIHTYMRSIEGYLKDPNAGEFDIVLMSLVLSSMQKNPPWDEVSNIIKEDGILMAFIPLTHP